MGNEKTIYIVILCGVFGVSLGLVIPAVMSERALAEMEPVQADVSPYVPPLLSSNLALLISVKGNICEECHMSGKVTAPQAGRIKDHIEGGSYCLKCHGFSHEKHPADGNVTCQSCHDGPNPKIPSSGESCGKCHAYPDALVPSYGNIAAIHQPRGVNCISCHLDCEKCHDQALSGRKWDKRLNHFNTLPDTYK